MAVPTVSAYSGTIPNKSTQTPREFSNNADLFLPWLATNLPNAIAAFVTQVNLLGAQCDADAVTAATSTGMLNAAIATVGATGWVSGTTYAIGNARWSPIDSQVYRRKTNGAGTTDPSADPTNWAAVSVALGESAGTAYRGDRGKTAYDHSSATGNPHGASTADIADSVNKRYCTDAQKTVLGNTSNTNTGDQDLSGLLPKSGGAMAGAITGLKETAASVGASALDLATANVFYKTISGVTTFTLSNVAATGTVSEFILELTNGGAFAVTWWSGIKWVAGTAPTLTASGLDTIFFYTRDGGTTWRGYVAKGMA